jgi:hypothetical protein
MEAEQVIEKLVAFLLDNKPEDPVSIYHKLEP